MLQVATLTQSTTKSRHWKIMSVIKLLMGRYFLQLAESNITHFVEVTLHPLWRYQKILIIILQKFPARIHNPVGSI